MAKGKKVSLAPLAERRGLQNKFMHDMSFYTLLVRADINKVTDPFAKAMKAKRVTKGVQREELPDCDVFGTKFFPFQYRGHAWTTVVHRLDENYGPQLARSLSEKLGTRAIFAGHHDTGGTVDWIMYDCGKLAEVFHYHDRVKFRTLTPAEFKEVESGFGKPTFKDPWGLYAASEVRELNVADFDKLMSKGVKFPEQLAHLLDDFLKSQDAFLALNWGDEGTEYFPLYDAADEEIVRIDMVEVHEDEKELTGLSMGAGIESGHPNFFR